MTAPTKALDLLADALASYRTSLRKASDAELEHRAASVAALPGWFADELRRLVDDERESRRLADRPTSARMPKVAAGAAVAAPIAVVAGRLLAEHAEQVPQVLLYSPAVAVGLVGAVVGGGRLGRWLDERRHGLAVDVDEADLDPLGLELLAQVRVRRAVGGGS